MKSAAVKSQLLVLLAASCSYESSLRERVRALEASAAAHQAELQSLEERQNAIEQRLALPPPPFKAR